MTLEELLILGKMGYTAAQVGQMVQAKQMKQAEPEKKPTPDVAFNLAVQQAAAEHVAKLLSAPPKPEAPKPEAPKPENTDPFQMVMEALGGLKQTIQASAINQVQQPAVQSADDITAMIIAPPPPKE